MKAFWKKLIIFSGSSIRVIGGLVSLLILIVGLGAAWKEFWNRVRRKKMDKTL